MGIDVRIVGADVILRPQGPVTELNGTIDRLMSESHHTRFVVDLADLPVLDSDDLGEIVRAYVFVNRRRASLRLVNPTERTAELLLITQLGFLLDGAEGDDKADVGSRLKPREPLNQGTVSLRLPTAGPELDD